MHISVGAVFLLLLGGSPALAISGEDTKDELIQELQRKIDALSGRVEELEGNQDLPEEPTSLEAQLDEAILQSPAEPVRTPARLNFSAPGLDRIAWDGGFRFRSTWWDPFGPARDQIWSFDQRLDLGMSMRVTEKTELYVELHDQRVWGSDLPLSVAPEDNDFEIASVHLDIDNVYESGFDLRIGRQLIKLGSERHFGDPDWLNTPLRFDGITGTRQMMDGNGELFLGFLRLADGDQGAPLLFNANEFSPVGTGATTSDLYIGYYTMNYMNTEDAHGDADLYVFFLDADPQSGVLTGAAPGAFGGETQLIYYGARADFHQNPIFVEGEFTTQFGKIAGNRTNDYGFDQLMIASRAGFETEDVEYFRTAYVGWDFATGGTDAYIPLFPDIHNVFGLTDFATWRNIEHWVVGATFDLLEEAEDALDVSYRWLRQQSDGTTTGFGFAGYSLAAAGNGAKEIGQELDIHYYNQCTDSSEVNVGFAWFFPGDAYHRAVGNESDVIYMYLTYGLRF